MKLLKMFPRDLPILGKALTAVAFSLCAAPLDAAQSVALVWDPSPDVGAVANYRVHYGTSSGGYSQTTNAGVATNLTVQGLSDGTTYFFAVTAVGTNQLESDFSNEVSYSVPVANTPPTISPISNWTLNEDASTGSISFTISDAQTAAGSLTLTRSSSDTALVPNNNIVFGGTGSSRTVTVTPAADAYGTAQITVSVSDGDLSASRTFTLTVNSVNDAPTLAAIGDMSIAQDAGQQTVSLSGIGTGAANESQTLTVTASSSNPSLIPTPSVNYSSPSSTGTLRFTPAAGQSGSAQITVTVADNGGTANGGVNTSQRSFAVNVVVSVNAAPTLADISDQTVVQAAGELGLNLGAMGAGTMIWAVEPGGAAQPQTVNLTGIGTGGESGQTLTVTTSSSNPTLVPNPTVNYTSPNSTGSLSFTPAVGGTGTAIITVSVKDNGGGTDTIQKSFTVNVTGPANTAPTLTTISSQSMNEDGVLGPLGFTVSDAQTSAGSLVVSASSGNPTLITSSALQLGGSSASRNITVRPVANQSGKALVTLTVTDALGAMGSKAFWVNVTPVNDAPTLDAVADVQLTGAPAETVALGGIGVGPLDGVQGLMVQAASSNPSIIAQPEVVYYSPSSTAELQLVPIVGASGSATITVTVKDDGGTANGGQDTTTRTFTVTTATVVAAASDPEQTSATTTSLAVALAAPAGPLLHISQQNGSIVLSWDGAAGPYVLERNAGVQPQGEWSAVATQPVPGTGTILKVILQPQHSTELFRLARQQVEPGAM